jgi:hypothetical protein
MLVGMRDSVAVIAEGNFHGVSGFGGHDLDARRTADFMDGVVGIVQDVEKDLLQLLRVAHDVGQFFVKVFDDLDAVAGEVVGPQLHRAAQNQRSIARHCAAAAFAGRS